jgi:hypothetical protein
MSKPDATPTTSERRIAPRLRPALGTTFRSDVAGDGSPVLGLVWNISLSGVSMLLPTPPKPGDILAGELTAESGGASLAVLMRAVHVKPVPTGDYMLGAQFLRELTPAELAPFVDPVAKGAVR